MSSEFRPTAPSAETVFYRSYSRRKPDGSRESYKEAITRAVNGVAEVGGASEVHTELMLDQALKQHAFPSGRALWVGGSEWAKRPENHYGWYNCSSVHIDDLKTFGLLMDMAMQGTGTGAVLEKETIDKLPVARNRIEIIEVIPIGDKGGNAHTNVLNKGDHCILQVGDSRQGWVDAYQGLINAAFSEEQFDDDTVRVVLDLSNVRPSGERLKGFGGTANPIKLEEMFRKIADLLSGCQGRKMTSVEACLLIDEAATCVVAGNVRRSAGLRQFSSDDQEAIHAKEGLYSQDEQGNWRVDPKKEALRMANHTICYHKKPSLEEIKASVTKQFYSGEGAIQYTPEGIARANADLLPTAYAKDKFIRLYEGYGKQAAKNFLYAQANAIRSEKLDERELEHRVGRYGGNPCASYESQLLTADGYKEIGTLEGQVVNVVNHQGKVTTGKVWCSGVKQLQKITLSTKQRLRFTADHVFMTDQGEKKISEAVGCRLVPFLQAPEHNTQHVCLGYILGDGVLTDVLNPDKRGIGVCFGEKDVDVATVFNQHYDASGVAYTVKTNSFGSNYLPQFNQQVRDLGLKLVPTYLRELPSTYQTWDKKEKAAFLSGLYSANGSIITPKSAARVALKAVSRVLVDQVQETLLNDFGIESYITTNKAKVVSFSNGDYTCKESYDLNIQRYEHRLAFYNNINFVHHYKREALESALKRQAPIVRSVKPDKIEPVYDFSEPETNWGVIDGFVVHNCMEIQMKNSLCNLSEVHLNTLDPGDKDAQYKAFYAAGLQVACLLKHRFIHERIQYSREIDPIVGVSFTGLFDFFVHAFGAPWLEWMFNDRPEGTDFERLEQEYLKAWKEAAHAGVYDFCTEHGLRLPNRWTVVQPGGSKSLLTGASSGWHPPYAQRFIRRITLGKQDPLVSALRDWGYPIVPAPSARDDEGNLLNDIADPRVHEVLVEIPTEVSWANLPGVDQYDLNQISAVAQMRLYMNVQRHYTTHTTSATISFRENEIDALSQEIYDAIGTGYIGVALLARFDANATFPRLPFEPITKEKYDELMEAVNAWRLPEDEELGFLGVLAKYDRSDYELVTEAACTSAACIARAEKDEQEGKA